MGWKVEAASSMQAYETVFSVFWGGSGGHVALFDYVIFETHWKIQRIFSTLCKFQDNSASYYQ